MKVKNLNCVMIDYVQGTARDDYVTAISVSTRKPVSADERRLLNKKLESVLYAAGYRPSWVRP